MLKASLFTQNCAIYSYPAHSTNVSIALKKTSSQGQENKIFDND